VTYLFETTENNLPEGDPPTIVGGKILALYMPPAEIDGSYYASGMVFNSFPKKETYPFWVLEGKFFRIYLLQYTRNDFGKRHYAFIEIAVFGTLDPKLEPPVPVPQPQIKQKISKKEEDQEEIEETEAEIDVINDERELLLP